VCIKEKRLKPVCNRMHVRFAIDVNIKTVENLKIEEYKERCVAFVGLSKNCKFMRY